MKLAIVTFVILIAFCLPSNASHIAIGSRLPGDKLLYTFYLQDGPNPTPTNIDLFFDYRVDDIFTHREYLTQINFTRPNDDLIPNYFERMELNSTHLNMTPVRTGVTEWWLQGDPRSLSFIRVSSFFNPFSNT